MDSPRPQVDHEQVTRVAIAPELTTTGCEDELSSIRGPCGIERAARVGGAGPGRQKLEIVSIRVERLHDITEEDAIREGLAKITKDGGRNWKYGIPDKDGLPGTDDIGWPWIEWEISARDAFKKLWVKINGDDSWKDNPWVWRIEFTVLPQPPQI